jgi:ABC-2 type transport system ATP-binding protein
MLRIDNLTHVYPNGTRALDGVTLEVPRGMFGLLGPNGAGKSSLMRCIATLQIPTQGAIRFGDLDVLASPDALRRTLGYLPQDFGVYPRVTAHDMLDHLAVLKGFANGKERRETVDALLHQVNLWDVRKKALDPEERNRFLNLLAEIGENVVVILSTHIVEDVADLCPSMAIIASGRIVKTGAPLQLIASMNGRVWRKTIARDELGAHQREHDVIATRLFGGRTVIHVLADTDPGDGFEPMQGGLEDVYFSTLAGTRRQAA